MQSLGFRFIKKLFVCLLGFFLLPLASAQAEKTEGKDFTIATGARVQIKGKKFSIIPPQGWEVHQSYPGLSLLLQVPFAEGLKYQRTIQIMTFNEARYIDDVTRREFEEIIIKRYSTVSQSISNYRMRNHLITKMEDGNEGILYYTEFNLDDKEMMQAHILVSSATNHYLLTYTDVAEHFQGDAANEYLTKAWEAMVSIQVGEPPPVRFRKPVVLGLGLIALLVLAILFFIARHFFAARRYAKPSDPEGYDDDDDSSAQGRSRHGSQVSHMSGLNENSRFATAMKSNPPSTFSDLHSHVEKSHVEKSHVDKSRVAKGRKESSQVESRMESQVEGQSQVSEFGVSEVKKGGFKGVGKWFSGRKKRDDRGKHDSEAATSLPAQSMVDDDWGSEPMSQQKSAVNDKAGTSGVSKYNDDDDDDGWK